MAIRAGRIVLEDVAGETEAKTASQDRINLDEHEASPGQQGGHTLAKHVGRTEAQLRQRLVDEPARDVVSSFATKESAEESISEALQCFKSEIEAWAPTAKAGARFWRTYPAGKDVGYAIFRNTVKLENLQCVRFGLQARQEAGRLYYIVTAYPSEP